MLEPKVSAKGLVVQAEVRKKKRDRKARESAGEGACSLEVQVPEFRSRPTINVRRDNPGLTTRQGNQRCLTSRVERSIDLLQQKIAYY